MKTFLNKHPKIKEFIFNITIVPTRFLSFWFKCLLRIFGIKGKHDYSQLKKYKNAHNGERCFIVGTGPSLTMQDLEMIKEEYSFSVNSIVLSFKDTSWRPTYYAIQDKNAYERLKGSIKNEDFKEMFVGISNKNLTPIVESLRYIPYPLNILDRGKIGTNHLNRFSGNAFKVVYDGHSITYSCIELAVYMGFKQIVFLGVDCDYSKKVNHIVAYSSQGDPNAAYLMHESYKCAARYAHKHGVQILNATRNAKLDVFKRVCLEDIFKQK